MNFKCWAPGHGLISIILFCFKVCYDNYDRSIEDEDDFFPNSRKHTSSDAWRYQSVKELDGHDISGILDKWIKNFDCKLFIIDFFIDTTDCPIGQLLAEIGI